MIKVQVTNQGQNDAKKQQGSACTYYRDRGCGMSKDQMDRSVRGNETRKPCGGEI